MSWFSVHRLSLAMVLALALGCGSRTNDESSGSSTTDTSSSSSGESGINLPTDEQLRATCEAGCVRFKECAPEAYAAAYAEDAACADYCFDLFDDPDACRAASVDYAACTAALSCADWPDLLDDPATSICSDSWAPVKAHCPVP